MMAIRTLAALRSVSGSFWIDTPLRAGRLRLAPASNPSDRVFSIRRLERTRSEAAGRPHGRKSRRWSGNGMSEAKLKRMTGSQRAMPVSTHSTWRPEAQRRQGTRQTRIRSELFVQGGPKNPGGRIVTNGRVNALMTCHQNCHAISRSDVVSVTFRDMVLMTGFW